MRVLLLVAALTLAGCVVPEPVPPTEGVSVGAAWRSHAEGPTPRAEVASGILEGRAVVVGGFTTDGAASRLVESYDPVADAWSRGPDYPFFIHHAAAATVEAGPGAGLYVIGGWISPPLDARFPILPVVTPMVFRLAPGASEWTPVARLPEPRAGHAAAAWEGKIYVLGGITAAFELTSVVHVYDAATDSWSTGPPLPTPRDHTAAAAQNGWVHLVAGQELSHALNVVAHEALNVATGEWVRLADAPTARDGLVAVAWDGRILAIGGQTDKDVFDLVEAYDPATDTWSALAPLPTARHGLGAVTLDGRVYTLLGGTIAGSPEDLSGAVESFGP